MKENRTKISLLLLLVGVAILLNFCGNRNSSNSSNKSQKGEFHVSEEPIPEAEIHEWNENRISNMQDKPEDNLPSEEKKERKVEVQFKGYEEYPGKFAWLREEDWKRFQEEVKQYLYVKGFETVTTVNLHSDTIQIINEYERNLYFDIDYRTDTSDTLTIKAVCDTYQESDQMRFGFEIQYGTGRE